MRPAAPGGRSATAPGTALVRLERGASATGLKGQPPSRHRPCPPRSPPPWSPPPWSPPRSSRLSSFLCSFSLFLDAFSSCFCSFRSAFSHCLCCFFHCPYGTRFSPSKRLL